MRHSSPKEVAAQWVAAYNRHDVEAAIALYDEQAINIQQPWRKSVSGRDAMRAIYIHVFQAFPDIVVDAEHVTADGNRVAIEWCFRGTMRGEFAGHAPTNRAFTLHGCEIFELSDGRISIQRGYWDKATMLEQLGINTKRQSG